MIGRLVDDRDTPSHGTAGVPDRHSTGRLGRWRRLVYAAMALALIYVGAVVYLAANETALIFRNGRPLGTARPAPPAALVEYPGPDGSRLPAWRVPDGDPATNGAWVLFFHGNAATIGSRINVAHYDQLRALGINVFAPEYRGYAGIPGTPTEASVAADARAAWDFLREHEQVPASRIAIYGWSLGSGVAVTLAAGVDEAAVILEGAPASVADIGVLEYPYMPVRLIIRNPFDSIARIGRIGSPVLFLHSPEDRMIPIAEGRRLFEAAAAPRTFVEVRGGHVDASEVDRDAFYAAVRSFLDGQHLLGR
jgi:dipeptidyl aminopeptidase/acylaminoacyl peptidase